MNYRDKFWDFLKSNDSVMKIEKNENIYEIVKIPYGNNLDLLYSNYGYYKKINVNTKLEYSGVYDRVDNKIYDLHSNIKDVLDYSWEEKPFLTGEDILHEMNAKIQDCITDYVLDNSDEFYEVVPNDYEPYINEVAVYKDYFDGITKLEYKNSYSTDDYNTLLEYLDKGDDFIYDLSLKYVMRNKEAIGERLVDVDTKNKYLDGFENNKDHRIHKIKDIINSLKDVDCNMVHVFINKDDLNYDFKYERDRLLNRNLFSYDYSYLSTWNIPAKERNEFKNLFGRNADFNYDDITKIEFRNEILYLDRDFGKSTSIEATMSEEEQDKEMEL